MAKAKEKIESETDIETLFREAQKKNEEGCEREIKELLTKYKCKLVPCMAFGVDAFVSVDSILRVPVTTRVVSR